MGSNDMSLSAMRTEDENVHRGQERTLQKCRLGLDQPWEFARAVVEAREDGLQVGDADVFGKDISEHRAEIRGERQVAALVELMIVQPWPFAIDLPAANVSAHHEHAIRVAVVRAPVAVLARRASEFAHADEYDVLHAVAQILMNRREPLAEIAQQIRQL